MAHDPSCNPTQNEELRADMTGVFLRWLNDESPKLGDYDDLFEEPETPTHPAGEKRKAKIATAIELCESVDAMTE